MSLQIWCSPVQTPVKNTPQSQSPPRSLCPGTLLHHAQFTWHDENFVSEHWPARSFTARQQGELLTLSEADFNQSLAVSTEDLASDVITNRIPGVKKKKENGKIYECALPQSSFVNIDPARTNKRWLRAYLCRRRAGGLAMLTEGRRSGGPMELALLSSEAARDETTLSKRSALQTSAGNSVWKERELKPPLAPSKLNTDDTSES